MNTLSNTTAIVSSDVMPSKNILEGFSGVAVASKGYNKKRDKLLDVCRAAKVPYTHFLSPNGGRTSLTTCPSQAYWDAIVGAVTAGQDEPIQKLMATPTTALTPAQKKLKSDTRKEIGSVIGKIAAALKKNPEKGPRVLLTGKAKASNDMQLFVDKVRKYSDMDHDIVQQVDLLLAMSRTFGLDVK